MRVPSLDDEFNADWLIAVTRAREAAGRPSSRHQGPGPHANGSPQSIHGKGDGGGPLSIAKQGGDSVQVSGRRPSSGYMVARPPSFGTIVTADDWFARGDRILVDFVNEREAQFKSDPDAFVGVWWDRKHREFALDVSMNVADLDDALSKGRAWDQQAIWDVVNMVEIPTGGTGGRSGQVGRSPATGLVADDRRGEARLGSGDRRDHEGGIRGRGRVTDPEVAEALERFYLRHLAGQHNQKTHGHGGGTISPGVQAAAPALGRVENPVDGPDGTDWGSLDPKQQAKMQKANDKLGIPDVDAQEQNLTAMVAVIPPGGMENGRQWWKGAQQRTQAMAEERPGDRQTLTREKSTAMTAAMSPQCRWETNLVWADHVTDIVRRDPVIDDSFLDQEFSVGGVTRRIRDDLPGVTPGRRFSEYDRDTQSWLAIRSGQKPMTTVSVAGPDKGQTINANAMMGTSVRSALDIAYAPRGDAAGITEHLGGHKTRSFYNNMLTAGGPPGVVTIDVHASDAAWLGISSHAPAEGHPEYRAASATDTQRKALTGGSNVAAGVKGTAYAPTAEAYRRVTETYNSEHGTDYTVADMQAAVWLLTIGGN